MSNSVSEVNKKMKAQLEDMAAKFGIGYDRISVFGNNIMITSFEEENYNAWRWVFEKLGASDYSDVMKDENEADLYIASAKVYKKV